MPEPAQRADFYRVESQITLLRFFMTKTAPWSAKPAQGKSLFPYTYYN
ncbi:Uncharacterised protein [Cronobacter universalis NCTC 9529]|uniref:Uncharacterized protein n=1 Tax=Cronobacter universalis NCTC 9529 TaxID=1074000 RepID=A0ABY1W625_9ENTR|nr:Uncharacterised protein [Cronobacter universalis NCTC 9529]